MVSKSLSAALIFAAATATMATAQGRPPAEQPPAGYAGQQYVDSRGCLFVRAGHGGQVNWVSRIDRSRRPICGQTPSVEKMAAARSELAQASQVQASPPAAPVAAAPVVNRAPAAAQYVPPPVSYGAPRPLAPAAQAAPAAMASGRAIGQEYQESFNPSLAPARKGVESHTVGGHPSLVSRARGCPADAPHGRIYALRDGRSVLLCATAPHQLTGISTEAAQAYAGPRPTAAPAHVGPVQVARTTQPPVAAVDAPAGYKAAWQDDRLNPHRAWGTPEGQAAMDRKWTRETPANLQPRRQPATAHVSTKGDASAAARAPAQRAEGRFVQVGSFAVAQNAQSSAARLSAMGYPVQVVASAIRGRPVQVVRAGPFAAGGAEAALRSLRGAGFGDAIVTR